jgi:hypothetical protein
MRFDAGRILKSDVLAATTAKTGVLCIERPQVTRNTPQINCGAYNYPKTGNRCKH